MLNQKKFNALYNYNLNLDKLERLTFLEMSQKCLDDDDDKFNDRESFCKIPK